jgi:hypothetical protein
VSSKKRKTPSTPRPHNSEPGFYGGTDDVTETRLPKTMIEWAVATTQVTAPQDELLDESFAPEIEVSVPQAEEERDPEPVSERRLTSTLLRIFSRRRLQIRLSTEQLSRLSGISVAQLATLEGARPGQTLSYEHAIVLARALGVSSAHTSASRSLISSAR